MSPASRRIFVADLGLGNLRSVCRAVSRAGGEPILSSDPEVIRSAGRLIVPGQGAFGGCAAAARGEMGAAILEVIRRGDPYFGICLGMQLLFDDSEEAPECAGLGVFRGRVRRLAPEGTVARRRLKVPHMGWNEVHGAHALLPEAAWFYFVHSYQCAPVDDTLVVGRAEYGGAVCAAVARDNVFACQFHPEKSQAAGHRLLERFVGSDLPWK